MPTVRILPFVAVAFVAACSSESTPKPQEAAPDGGVSAKGVVRVHYPEGKGDIALTGDHAPLTETPTPMTKVGANTWELDLGLISSDVAVHPTLGGTPSRGPAYTVHPGQTLDVYPHFVESKGKVSTLYPAFESKVHPLKDNPSRHIQVYLPPTYLENTEARFPVLYMTDAQIVFGTSNPAEDTAPVAVAYFGDMLIDETMDAASETGAIAEVIIVGVDTPIVSGTDPLHDRVLEMTPTVITKDPTGAAVPAGSTGEGPQFMEMIVSELKPKVDADLRTIPGRDTTFMSGASLGGLMSLYAGEVHGDVFGGGIVSFSGSAWWDDTYIVKLVQKNPKGPNLPAKIYADVGDQEVTDTDTSQVDDNKLLFKALADAGYVEGQTLKTLVAPGAKHTGSDWAKRVPDAFAFALGKGR